MLGNGHVGDTQLHPFSTLPAVNCEIARDMQQLPTIFRERAAELLADGAEGNAVNECAVAGLQANAQVRLPDLLGVSQLMRRQRDQRLRIAAAERSGALQSRHELRG